LVITAARNQQRESGKYSVPPTVGNTVAKNEPENFICSLPIRVQVKLDQKFGKNRIAQSFKSEACLRQVLIPLYKSGFLLKGKEWETFEEAFHMVKMFLKLWDEHTNIEFAEIKGFQKDWDVATKIDPTRVWMATAALLHLDGDIADTVRWIGGPHVGAHRDVEKTLCHLRGKVDAVTYDTLEASWNNDVPKLCNAEASEENFRAYLEYGNHETVTKKNGTCLQDVAERQQEGILLIV
jgi:hypothetical protein